MESNGKFCGSLLLQRSLTMSYATCCAVLILSQVEDGHHVWEAEAKVDKDSFKSNTLVVEIPPYRNQRLSGPAHVNFYVCNGKRKRSQCQRFTYLPSNGHFDAHPPYAGTASCPADYGTRWVGPRSGVKQAPDSRYQGRVHPGTRLPTLPQAPGPRPRAPGDRHVPIIKTEPNDEFDSLGAPRPLKPYYGLQPRLSPIIPLGDGEAACLVGDYPPGPPPPPRRHASPGSSPTYSPGPAASILRDDPGCGPASPADHGSSPSLVLLRSRGSPRGYHPGYGGYGGGGGGGSSGGSSSASSSPGSHPSTAGESSPPFMQVYSPVGSTGSTGSTRANGGSPDLLPEDAAASSPAAAATAVTVKQEPQELDQMYLDDGESCV
ncbi:hypothetical protein NHX12_001510 [Muraenolepis orangiensis]|uniref:Rel homology dimerisation domain-containing protein n=1 Tax=Muraenolepis orangiensis TaxID=630683 RepID=A0A9Q0E367_9TELE|nr:hypothetical protein NHX12_001510 [Muraenolepis orangiensis]